MELDSYFRLLTTEWARTCPSPRLSGHASPLHPHRSRVCFARGGFLQFFFFTQSIHCHRTSEGNGTLLASLHQYSVLDLVRSVDPVSELTSGMGDLVIVSVYRNHHPLIRRSLRSPGAHPFRSLHVRPGRAEPG